MKNLFILMIICASMVTAKAQATFFQYGSSETIKQFAESPQKCLSDLRQLRGFGCFLEVLKSDKASEKLANFYQKGKDGNDFLVLFIVAEIVNEEGKVVAKSKKRKVQMSPNKKMMFKDLVFPGDQAGVFFADEMFGKLDKGQYQLKLNVMHTERAVKNLIKTSDPKTILTFKK